ncbi:hypothetical protein F5X96DRAFT_671290 [Biscogniauxia mediterranea]|nr:hypothetical protein F5X96DRAFT_671290 [Biscogniauxia mediterranea]
MTREVKHKKPRSERKPRWRTLSPNARAAKVTAREERKAAFDAAHGQPHKAATPTTQDNATQPPATHAAATADGNSATEHQNSPTNANTAPRLAGNKRRQGRKRKTARVDGKAQAPEEDLPEASATTASDPAVTSGEVEMPDASDGGAKVPEENSNPPNNNTPKEAASEEAKTEAEEPAAVDNDNGGVRLLRSRTRAQ